MGLEDIAQGFLLIALMVGLAIAALLALVIAVLWFTERRDRIAARHRRHHRGHHPRRRHGSSYSTFGSGRIRRPDYNQGDTADFANFGFDWDIV